MKTANLFLMILLLVLLNPIFGQKHQPMDTSAMCNVYIYKTRADFFNDQKTYIGKQVGMKMDDGILKYLDRNTNTLREINIKDSSYAGYYYSYNTWKRYPLKMMQEAQKPLPHVFCGGNSKIYCYSATKGYGTYDSEGFMSGDFISIGNNMGGMGENDYTEFVYVDKDKNTESTKIEVFLQSKPMILSRYLAEKEQTKAKDWRHTRHAVAMKYFKEYISAK